MRSIRSLDLVLALVVILISVLLAAYAPSLKPEPLFPAAPVSYQIEISGQGATQPARIWDGESSQAVDAFSSVIRYHPAHLAVPQNQPQVVQVP